MEIGQNIKEFTEQGEVVLIYSLSDGNGRELMLTNVTPRPISYIVDGVQMISGYDRFINSRVDRRAKIWSAEAEDDGVVFSIVEDDEPQQITFSLTDDGFSITKLSLEGARGDSSLESFYFELSDSATLSVGGASESMLSELPKSQTIDVEGWSDGKIFNVAELRDGNKSILLRSSMPQVTISHKGGSVAMMPADFDAESDFEPTVQDEVRAIEHNVIYSLRPL